MPERGKHARLQLDAALLSQMVERIPHVVSLVDRERRLVWVNRVDEDERE